MDQLIPMGVAIFFISLISQLIIQPLIIPRLKSRGIAGRDMHKKDKPIVAEMGGLGMLFSISFSLLFVIFCHTFLNWEINITSLMAGMITLLLIGLIGIIDDLLDLPQKVKAFLPILASIPLIAIRAGTPEMYIPFIGDVDFGLIYTFILVPIGVTVASNLTNMLAGFNGNEAGMSLIMFLTLSVITYFTGSSVGFVISVSMVGLLLGFLYFNWYPARVFPGDTGTFLMGGALAVVAILANVESYGAILVVPHVIDFFIKIFHRFPKTFGQLGPDGKLYPPDNVARGLGQLIMKISDGITEKRLTITLILIELVFAIISLTLFFLR